MGFESRLSEVKSATIERFTASWQSNYQANRQMVQGGVGIPKLKDQFKDVPCIVVGAGPSLEKNLKFLRWAMGKCILIACDASLSVLLSQGIKPNFVTALDPQARIIKFFLGIDTYNLRLVAPTIIHPKILDFWKGSVFFYNKFAPDIPLLTKIVDDARHVGVLTPGGNVLTITFDLAFQLGASPIIFVGQDLSFPKGKGHTFGTIYDNSLDDSQESILRRQQENIVMEKNIFGKEVPTVKSMSVSKTWYNWAFREWKRSNPARIVNSSEDGILAGHCEIMPLKESVQLFCKSKVNVDWKLEKLLKRKKR